MTWLDARLPLRFGPLESRRPGEAVLTDGADAAPPAARFVPAPMAEGTAHVPGCACCQRNSPAAVALAALFRQRALSPSAPFRGVLVAVGPAGEAVVRAALEADPLVSARFRLIQ